MPMSDSLEENWYVVKQASEQCKILPAAELDALLTDQTGQSAADAEEIEENTELMKWGPFKSQNQAIAKRIGLIRAGKCQPVV